MDLKSIINSDSNSNPPSQRVYANSYESLSQGFQDARPSTRPPQPPPLHPPAYRDIPSPNGSFSHRSAQSPYQVTPTSSIAGHQYPFPQSHHHPSPVTSSHSHQFPQQGEIAAVMTPGGRNYGQPSPSILTPTSTTPAGGYGYPQYHRPPSSHSATTPTSAQSHVQSFSRDSPRTLHTHINASPHQHSAQHYHSQPGTPLGPPPPIGRPSPVSHRGLSGPSPYESYRSQSGSSHGHHQIPAPLLVTEAPNVLASPVNYNSRPPLSNSRSYMTDEERERSQSVSPKTIPSQTKSEQMDVTPEAERRWSGGVTPAKRKLNDDAAEPRSFSGEENHSYCEQRITHEPNNGQTVQTNPEQDRPLRNMQAGHEQQGIITSTPSVMGTSGLVQVTKEFDQVDAQNLPTSGSAAVTLSRQQPTTPQVPTNQRTPTSQTSPTPPSAGHANSPFAAPTSTNSNMPRSTETTVSPAPAASSGQPPMRKRQKFESPPIFAQSRRAGRNGSGNPLLPNRRPIPAKAAPHIKQEQHIRQEGNGIKDHGPYPSPTPVIIEGTNGHSTGAAEITKPKTRPRDANEEVLGPWEKSITDMEPADEIMRTIADFLFTEIVLRNDVGAGPVGGGSAPGAVLEIEAKIGQIIDKNTNERLRLPVMTECVVSKNDPNLRIAFKSSMTEAQHRSLNKFLNEAFVATVTKPIDSTTKPRVPMTYVHTRECDSFYELSQSGELALPPSIRAQINPRHNKAKVRVTRDQKTGAELAKIVKVRVADLDVHSPKTPFDWRVSVNLEMQFHGDMRDLVEVMEGGRRAPERNKDRVTYRHLAYQIDLTQVTSAEAPSNATKEHELEIELSTAEVRKHGNLLKTGQESGFDDLVKGFVDNVRVLTRLFSR